LSTVFDFFSQQIKDSKKFDSNLTNQGNVGPLNNVVKASKNNNDKQEIVLTDIFPDIVVNQIKTQQLNQEIHASFDINVNFDVDVSLVKNIINKYFKLKIEKLETNNKSDVDNVKRAKLFSFEQIDKKKITKVTKIFENPNIGEYNFIVSEDELRAKDIKSKNLLYRISIFFDFDLFNKEFNTKEKSSSNGKSILIGFKEDGSVVEKMYQHRKLVDGSVWQGSYNVSNNELFTYSKLLFESQKITFSEEKLGKKSVKPLDLSNLFNFSVDLTPPEQKILSSRFNIHEFGAVSSPVQVFFDLDWLGIMNDNSVYVNLMKNKPELSLLSYIEELKVYRARKDQKKSLLSSLSFQNGDKIDKENNKIKIQELKFDLENGNEYIKSFMFLDKTLNNKKHESLYHYSFEFHIKDMTRQKVEDNKTKLYETKRNLTNFQSNPNLEIESSVQNAFNSIELLSTEQKSKIQNQFLEVNKHIKAEKEVLLNFENVLDKTIGKFENLTGKERSFVFTLSVNKNYTHSQSSVSFLPEELSIKPEQSVLNFSLEQLETQPILDIPLQTEFLSPVLTLEPPNLNFSELKPPTSLNFVINKIDSDFSLLSSESENTVEEKVVFEEIKDLETLLKEEKKPPLAKIVYFAGYEMSEEGQVLLKRPKWKEVGNINELQSKNLLMRYNIQNDFGVVQPKIKNRYFLLGDVKIPNQNLSIDEFI